MRTPTFLIAAVTGALALPGAALAQDWSGPYVGAQLGWVSLETDAGLDISGAITTALPLAISNAENRQPRGIGDEAEAFGGYAGYLLQRGDWVVGAEVEYNEGGNYRSEPSDAYPGGNASVATFTGMGVRSDWSGALRLRGGRLLTPKLLVYGIGGYALRQVQVTNGMVLTLPAAPGQFAGVFTTAEEEVSGWVLGVGTEWRPFERWGLRLEYARTEYDDVSDARPLFGTLSSAPGFQGDARFTAGLVQEEVRLGVSYQF